MCPITLTYPETTYTTDVLTRAHVRVWYMCVCVGWSVCTRGPCRKPLFTGRSSVNSDTT